MSSDRSLDKYIIPNTKDRIVNPNWLGSCRLTDNGIDVIDVPCGARYQMVDHCLIKFYENNGKPGITELPDNDGTIKVIRERRNGYICTTIDGIRKINRA